MRNLLVATLLLLGTTVGCVLPLYSSNQDKRAKQMIFHSEDLRHVPEIWNRAWASEMPDVATPYRVHGGVI
ncbi:MAG: hypothetical protein ACE5KM_04750 [Planctomycetaceae bacterium]